jgi:hypothetical protein
MTTPEPVDVRLPLAVTASQAARIEEWRRAQHPVIPNRTAALRLLIEAGLDAAAAQAEGAAP